MKKYLAALTLLSSTHSMCAEEPRGPHGGKIVENETHTFEVKIDSKANHIDVYTIKTRKKAAPRSMSLTLFRDKSTGQTIELRPVSLKDPLPRFQGELSSNAGSYIGAELRFEVSLKDFGVLRFIPPISTRSNQF